MDNWKIIRFFNLYSHTDKLNKWINLCLQKLEFATPFTCQPGCSLLTGKDSPGKARSANTTFHSSSQSLNESFRDLSGTTDYRPAMVYIYKWVMIWGSERRKRKRLIKFGSRKWSCTPKEVFLPHSQQKSHSQLKQNKTKTNLPPNI